MRHGLLAAVLLLALVACGDSSPSEPAAGPGSDSSAAAGPDPRVREIAAMAARNRQIEDALDQMTLDLDLRDVSIREATSFLSENSGLDIRLLPPVLEGLSEEGLRVTLQGEDISIRSALEIIAVTLHLSYRVEAGEVRIDR